MREFLANALFRAAQGYMFRTNKLAEGDKTYSRTIDDKPSSQTVSVVPVKQSSIA